MDGFILPLVFEDPEMFSINYVINVKQHCPDQ